MSHATEDNAEKYCGCAEEIPKPIVTPAEGHEDVYDPGRRLEAPYGTSQRNTTALARQQHGLVDAASPFGAPDEMMFS